MPRFGLISMEGFVVCLGRFWGSKRMSVGVSFIVSGSWPLGKSGYAITLSRYV